MPSPMKITPLMPGRAGVPGLAGRALWAAYAAMLALVLPVLAQAQTVAPTMRACVKAAAMPLSLNEPDGF